MNVHNRNQQCQPGAFAFGRQHPTGRQAVLTFLARKDSPVLPAPEPITRKDRITNKSIRPLEQKQRPDIRGRKGWKFSTS